MIPNRFTQASSFSGGDFVLDGTKVTADKLPCYNGLYDRHLVGFFEKKQHRKHLYLNGIIDKQGRIKQSANKVTNTIRVERNLQGGVIDMFERGQSA